MQKVITKYGLAAHLALLAVAPFFLPPIPVFWLSGLVALWVMMEPSRVGNEMLHDARRRVTRNVLCDPLFWLCVALAVMTGIRCLNDGVAMAYDAEVGNWFVAEPDMPFFPSAVKGSGLSEFAMTVALTVVLAGCRHALGRAARGAYLLVSSALSGVGVFVLILLFTSNDAWVESLVACERTSPAYWGTAFGVYLVFGVSALVAVFERGWHKALILTILSVTANAVGLFLFSPTEVSALFATVVLVVMLYSFFYLNRTLGKGGEFKFLVFLLLLFSVAWMVIVTVLPKATLALKLQPFETGAFFTGRFAEIRAVLSDLSLRAWKASPWLGGGLGSFPLALKFGATEADWLILSPLQKAPLNGYWLLIAERGTVGAFLMACPLGLLLWTYVVRMAKGIFASLPHPICWAGPLVLFAACAEMFVDASFLIPGAMIPAAALLALSANSFPKERPHG